MIDEFKELSPLHYRLERKYIIWLVKYVVIYLRSSDLLEEAGQLEKGKARCGPTFARC